MLRHKVMERTLKTMGLHPTYLEAFKATHDKILSEEVPISALDRHHIALMAVSRHSCMELLNVHESEIQSAISENNLEEADLKPKIRRLDRINKLLAHRPWAIKRHHIKELMSGENGSEKWSFDEIVIGMVTLCHFHSLASFLSGCGLLNDAREHRESESGENVPQIVKKMEDLKNLQEELDLSEVARRFETVKPAEEIPFSSRTPSSSSSSQGDSKETEENLIKLIDPHKYTSELDFQYVDFVKRDNPEESPTFRADEFGWIDYAFSVMSNFGGETLAELFDAKFSVITNLTYHNIGKFEAVDTRLFRMAVQRYAQCLFGIRHDDYDYTQINILLPRELKTYIKTLCCFPERCNIEEYEAIMADFRNSEKVHVCLLVCEARLQAELLYGLRAVSDHYNHHE